MLWHLRFSKDRDFIEDITEESGEVSEDFENEPFLPDSIAWMLDAFFSLSAARGGGFGPQPLQISAIDVWAGIHGVDDHPAFVRIMQALDNVWFEDWAKRNPAK